jgi:methylphosphotriester-DNA--protein-cysteine methyltransferase
MVAVTEQFLLERLSAFSPPELKWLPLIQTANQEACFQTVDSFCRRYGISRKHLNNIFKTHVGISPKMMFSLNRFQAVLQALTSAAPEKFSTLAFELNFFDQPHFNNSFQRFTGLTPHEYTCRMAACPSIRKVPHFVPYR